MGDNEAYLDNLLKSMNEAEDVASAGDVADNKMMTADEIAAMFAAMEQSAPTEESETPSEEENVPVEESFEDSMELPQDLLNDFLQKFEEQEAAENEANLVEVEEEAPGEEADFADNIELPMIDEEQLQEGYTTESTQNMSAEEIEQLLAATEQYAENDIVENGFDFSEEEASVDEMSNEDLLELLGGLDTQAVPDENGEDFAGELQATEAGDMMSGMAVAERAKERKERKKKEKLEKQAAKKALKEATKEAKRAAKEAKKQQAQRQKTTEEEMTLEEVGLEDVILGESVATESVMDLFADGGAEEDSVSIFDLAGVSESDINGSESPAEVVMAWDELDDNEVAEENASESKKSRKSKKKEKGSEDKKKNGLLDKVFAFLTEEDEDTASADENQTILDELEAEDKEAEKKKKGKKGKAAKGKKGKSEADGEDAEKPDKKKEKKKKAPKPKKVKEVKLKPIEEERPSKRVSAKSVAVIIAFAATVFIVIFFAGSYFSDILHRRDAKEAFDRMDYASCYAGLYGMELSEEEQEMLEHAELVLKMQRYIEIYEIYREDEKDLEALDSLMQAVAEYEELYAKALDCGAGPEVAALYEDVLDILQTSYGVSQEEAHSIAACESNVEYTRYLTALVGGEEGSVAMPDEGMQDVLPEEEELFNPDFAD